MTSELLIIFAKNPRLGKVKTRLAASIGPEKALRVYQFLLDHTHRVAESLQADKLICYSEFMPASDPWTRSGFNQAVQSGDDLGERMSNAFRSSFIKGYEKVVLIGSDCYDISHEEIQMAFDKLDHHDLVIGPAMDGGYYLIGMRQLIPKLFENKPWSSPNVLTETLMDASELHLNTHQLNPLADIDDMNDLMRYENLFALI